MKKNDVVTVTCDEVSLEGYGIVKPEGFVVFVRGLWKGDTARIIITRIEKRYGYGKILEMIQPSDAHIEDGCAGYPRCGGCSFRGIRYKDELAWKEQKVRECLKERISDGAVFEPAAGSLKTDRYRNKLQAPVSYADGKLSWGFYRVHSHDLIKLEDCLIEDETAVHLVNALCDELSDDAYGTYLRHILIRHGEVSGEYMIVLVSKVIELPGLAQKMESFIQRHPEVKSVILNHNPDDTNVILGKEDIRIAGNDVIRDTLKDLSFEISAHSFYQVNPLQCVNLYDEAKKFAGLTGKETVIDLYCGTGTITMWMADQAKEVIGIEIVKSAVTNAIQSSKKNGIGNVRFLCEDAGKGAEILRKEGKKADVVIVDPPRKGMDERSKENVLSFEPDRIVYVSCNPMTLARDLEWFDKHGYKTARIRPYDMFPRTPHVETVVLMLNTNCGMR